MGRLLDFEQGEFRPLNYPPGKGNPVCPFYSLLEVVADFTGTSINERGFCGHETKRVNTISFEHPLSGRRGTEYTPRTTCLNLARALELQLEIVDDPKPKDLDRGRRIDNMAADEIGIVYRQKKREEGRVKILERFREATFRNSTTSAENPHIARVNSASEISDQQAIQTARRFLNGILQATGSTFISFGAKGCPQSPRQEFVGEMS